MNAKSSLPVFTSLLTLLIVISVFAQGQPTSNINGIKQNTPTPSAETSPLAEPKTVLSPNERYEYDKLRLERDLQKELLDWAQTRFWILAALVVVVGFFGVRAFLREMVNSELKDASRGAALAEEAAKQTTEVIAQVRTEADKYRLIVAELSDTATKVDERFTALDARILSEGSHAIATSELQVSQLSNRLEELSGMVKTLASESEKNRGILQDYETRMLKLARTAEAESAEFSKNSKYSILVVYHPQNLESMEFGNELVRELTRSGYRASTSVWSDQTPAAFNEIRIRHREQNEKLGEQIYKLARGLSPRLNREIRIARFPELDRSISEDAAVFLAA